MRAEYGKRFDVELRNFLAELEDKSYIQEDLPEEAVGYRAMMSDFRPEDEIELFRAPMGVGAGDGRDEASEGEGAGETGESSASGEG